LNVSNAGPLRSASLSTEDGSIGLSYRVLPLAGVPGLPSS
jgi:hypothetical protein